MSRAFGAGLTSLATHRCEDLVRHSDTPSSSSHAEGIVLDCGHRTATRRIEECTIVDNCSFNVIGGIVSTRACQAQPAGLDVAAARRGTGGFIPGPYGPARPTLAAC